MIKINPERGKTHQYHSEIIKEEVKSGRYGSGSEVIRSALRVLGRELIKALEIGEQSGFVENFDPKQNLEELHRQYL
ncbi:hypothetical protein GCM10009118_03050 [Wandonia haliotis]|uniref:Type II toxin-antitoxin system ParD family antitoxin n=1 Tax=Wandonia haliotis TaxID=574963 RepID=A0ABN1MKZ9_9FLAO